VTNLCSPTMASAGAIVLKSIPWSGEGADPRRVAERVWDAMERQRIEDGVALRAEAARARDAANTPWNTPPRGLCADDGPKAA